MKFNVRVNFKSCANVDMVTPNHTLKGYQLLIHFSDIITQAIRTNQILDNCQSLANIHPYNIPLIHPHPIPLPTPTHPHPIPPTHPHPTLSSASIKADFSEIPVISHSAFDSF